MSADDEVRSLVIDGGSGWMKAGFSGDHAPHCCFSTLVARLRHRALITSNSLVDCFLAEEAPKQEEQFFNITHPVQGGMVVNWDDMEKLWHYIFYTQLKVAPEEHPVFLTQSALTPKANKEKTTQIMFETFNTPAMYVADQAEMTLCGAGRVSGVALECGHDVTCAVPVFEGYVMPHAVQKSRVAGDAVTKYLNRLMKEKGVELGLDIIMDIKEKTSFVRENMSGDVEKTVAYELPDGSTIRIGLERSDCVEVLFNPELEGLECDGIHTVLKASIEKCDTEIQKTIVENIVFSGGSSLLEGLNKRIEKELSMEFINPKTICLLERNYLSWIGGSITTSMSSFTSKWISKEEYDESGVFVCRRRSCW